MLRVLIVCIGGLLCLAGAHAAERISYRSGGLTLAGYLCLPVGPGPFAAVVYNHGGVGDRVGGAPRETLRGPGYGRLYRLLADPARYPVARRSWR